MLRSKPRYVAAGEGGGASTALECGSGLELELEFDGMLPDLGSALHDSAERQLQVRTARARRVGKADFVDRMPRL